PMTYPPWDIPNGVVVSGFPLPDRRQTYVRPAEAAAELGPASPLSYDETAAAMKTLDVATLEASNRVELEGLERAVGRYLARGFELVIGFTGIPDTLHHGFWAFHDAASPLHDPAAPSGAGRRLAARAPAGDGCDCVGAHAGVRDPDPLSGERRMGERRRAPAEGHRRAGRGVRAAPPDARARARRAPRPGHRRAARRARGAPRGGVCRAARRGRSRPHRRDHGGVPRR